MNLTKQRSQADITQLTSVDNAVNSQLVQLATAIALTPELLTKITATIEAARKSEDPEDLMICCSMIKLAYPEIDISQVFNAEEKTRVFTRWESMTADSFEFDDPASTFLAILWPQETRQLFETTGVDKYALMKQLQEMCDNSYIDYLEERLILMVCLYPELRSEPGFLSQHRNRIDSGIPLYNQPFGFKMLALAKILFPNDPIYGDLFHHFPEAFELLMQLLESSQRNSMSNFLGLAYQLKIIFSNVEIVGSEIILTPASYPQPLPQPEALPNIISF